MDRKYFILIGAVLIILLLALLLILPKSAKAEDDSIVRSIVGKSDKEENLNNYIVEKRETQTIQQRHDTIKLYVSTLENGRQNNAKTQSPSEAPQVCELSRNTVGDGSQIEKAEKLSDYLNDETEYDWGNVVIDAAGKPRIRAKKLPTEVLEQKKGLCGELANTLLLMAECTNLPIYFIYGGGHAWNVFVSGDSIVEIDTTQGCFDCDATKFEHAYPAVGLCSREKCITMSQVVELAINQQNIFDQTMGK